MRAHKRGHTDTQSATPLHNEIKAQSAAVLLVQVDDMLAQAQSVSRSLLEQRRIFTNVQDKLGVIGEKFPAISGLLNAIRRKKSRVR